MASRAVQTALFSPMHAAPQGDLSAQLGSVPDDWRPHVQAWADSADGQRLQRFLAMRLAAGAEIYPAHPFCALKLTPLSSVRVVVLGQDPYHGPGQAEGLAFSVPAGQKIPPSLRNIDIELERDLGLPRPRHGHLGRWAAQGVLLLNSCLTVEQGQPAAHSGQGWESLTDRLILATAGQGPAKVYLLWGAHALAKAPLVAQAGQGCHLILKANHPSPLSARRAPRPFIGCGHFSQAAAFLAQQQHAGPPLEWTR